MLEDFNKTWFLFLRRIYFSDNLHLVFFIFLLHRVFYCQYYFHNTLFCYTLDSPGYIVSVSLLRIRILSRIYGHVHFVCIILSLHCSTSLQFSTATFIDSFLHHSAQDKGERRRTIECRWSETDTWKLIPNSRNSGHTNTKVFRDICAIDAPRLVLRFGARSFNEKYTISKMIKILQARKLRRSKTSEQRLLKPRERYTHNRYVNIPSQGGFNL